MGGGGGNVFKIRNLSGACKPGFWCAAVGCVAVSGEMYRAVLVEKGPTC